MDWDRKQKHEFLKATSGQVAEYGSTRTLIIESNTKGANQSIRVSCNGTIIIRIGSMAALIIDGASSDLSGTARFAGSATAGRFNSKVPIAFQHHITLQARKTSLF